MFGLDRGRTARLRGRYYLNVVIGEEGSYAGILNRLTLFPEVHSWLFVGCGHRVWDLPVTGKAARTVLEFLSTRWMDVLFRSYQHASLVVQCLLLATVIALVIAALVVNRPWGAAAANSLSSIGLTLPSLALLGLMIPLFGIGTTPSVAIVTFYATLPIVRNSIVGLQGVDSAVLESARGQGMSSFAVLLRVRLPTAWPIIMTGVRVSAQMSMGIAAIAAYALGPGLGGYIYTGLSQIGGVNAVHYALVGTIGVVVVALIVDAILALIARATTSKGLRA